MKKILFPILFLTLAVPFYSRAEEVKEVKAMSPKDISNQMAELWCLKMQECSKDSSMGPRECKKILFKSFMTGFDKAAKQQKVEVMPQTFEECTKNVKAGSCESLKTAQTLSGCEFIATISKTN